MSQNPPSLIDTWREKASGRQMVLHICGDLNAPSRLYERYQTSDWCEIRIAPQAPASMLGAFHDLSSLPDDCADAVWLGDALERLPQRHVAEALSICYRILKPEGEMGLVTPDMQAIALQLAHGRLLLRDPRDGVEYRTLSLIYGENAQRHCGFTDEALAEALTAAGFSNTTIACTELNLMVGAFKYPSGHPKRIEKTRLLRNKNPEAPPKLPADAAAASHPGLLHKGKLPDELDVPPKLWGPVTSLR